jgi:hypothetical protein
MPPEPEDTPQQDTAASTDAPVAPVAHYVPNNSVVPLQRADLPPLVIDSANLPGAARELAKYLATSNHLFERGARAVKIVRTADGYKSEPLNVHSTVIEAHEVCQPCEERLVRGDVIRELVTLPNRVAHMFLNLSGRNLPALNGICVGPLLTDDGSIRCEQGYDHLAGLWCVGVDVAPILDHPKLEDARECFQVLRSAFATFPFADAARLTPGSPLVDLTKPPGVDESSFLLGLLTAVCRPSLPLAPALLVRAPQLSGSGTGKGLLVRAISQIAFNSEPVAFTSSGDGREFDKRIASALMEARPMLFPDNCNAEQLTSNLLAQAITESAIMTRLLGRSQMVRLTTNAFIAITGNAVSIAEDLARRVLVVGLDANCENPERRVFAEDFGASIRARRAELLQAVLTIWRWGRQTKLQPGLPLGSFEKWAAWCRDPLLALGCPDPVQRILEIKSDDPRREQIAEFLRVWWAHHGSQPVKLKYLHPTVVGLAGNRQKLGWYIQSMKDMRTSGFVMRVRRATTKSGTADYLVLREEDL